MKRALIFFLILAISCFGQTNLEGYYYNDMTLTMEGSPYIFTNNVFVKGANLVIEPGVTVQTNGHNLVVADTLANDNTVVKNSSLTANNVTFDGGTNHIGDLSFGYSLTSDFDELEFNTKVNIKNCVFKELRIGSYDFVDIEIDSSEFTTLYDQGLYVAVSVSGRNSKLKVENTKIENYKYPVGGYSGSELTLEGNSFLCENNMIAIGGGFFEDYTIPDIGFEYYIGNMSIEGCHVDVTPGLVLHINELAINGKRVMDALSNFTYYDASFSAENITIKSVDIQRINIRGAWAQQDPAYANITLNNCQIFGIQIMAYQIANILITNSVLNDVAEDSDYYNYLVQAENEEANVQISNCDISGYYNLFNRRNDSEGDFTIEGCNIACVNNAVVNTSSKTVIAKNNYWGDASGPYHSTLNPSGTGVTIEGDCEFTPWAETPFNLTSVKEDVAEPTFQLYQNYPNPFNPETVISFAIPNDADVKLDVFNCIGEHVATLFNTKLKAGLHETRFNMNGFSSGVYLYRLSAGDFVQVRKMVLLK